MPFPADESWPSGDPALASFVEDLRILAGGPAPEPGPGLVAVMRQGVLDPAPSPGRRKMLTKTVVGSLAAKVALGIGMAAASVTAAGAAGVLPNAAQHAVASVVGATTPFALPDPSAVPIGGGDDGTSSHTGAGGTDDRDSATVTNVGPTGPTSTTILGTTTTLAGGVPGTGTGGQGTEDRVDNHGACVSAVAHDASGSSSASHGKTVSSVARSDCGKAAATSTTLSPTTSTTRPATSTTSTTSASTGARQNGSGTASANDGHGNSGGSSAKNTSESSGKSGKD